jgi:hypothetical protein
LAATLPVFQPVPQEELALKEVAGAPGAAAVILFRESSANDTEHIESEHYRIKILTDEGRKYGNIEVAYSADDATITELKARVVSPDGIATDFNGEVREKVVLKKKGTKIIVKTLALPNVQTGSIVEYRYTRKYNGDYIFPRMWDIQSQLFTRRAHFVFIPYAGAMTGKYGKTGGLIRGIGRHEDLVPDCNRGVCDLTTRDIPPLVKEDYMPGDLDVKLWIKFIYSGNEGIDGSYYWPFYSEHETPPLNKFIGARAAIKQEADRVTSPTDSPTEKLRKIYQRAQQIRNTTFEPGKSAKELQGEKPNQNVEDVIRKGAGSAGEVNLLFIAMARALGFDAGQALLLPRSQGTFEKDLTDATLLEASVVWVMVDGKLQYFDPATKYCPFDLLPAEEAGASGIRLGGATSKGGDVVTTPAPQLADSLVTRTGTLKLDAEGTLSGTIQVSFERTEGLSRRLADWDTDAVGRAESLEDEMKGRLPADATVKLDSVQHWDDVDQPLVAIFTIQVPAFAQVAASRIIFPAELFAERMNSFFVSPKRANAIDWTYPYQRKDDIVLKIPAGYSFEALPEKLELSHFFGVDYSLTIEPQGSDAVRIRRQAVVKNYKFAAKQYAGLRAFFQKMIAGDQQQIVLKGAKTNTTAGQ